MSNSREQLQYYLSKIDITGKTVLDVGVRDNPASKYVKGKAKKYITLDIDNKWNPDIVADLNARMTTELKKEMIRFDIVFCLEVLEHCYNPVRAVENLFNFTKDGGVCYISAPFINPLHDEWDYLRYTPEWFKKVLPFWFKEVIINERVATEGQESLLWFYKQEGLRMSKLRYKRGEGDKLPLIGCFVKAIK